MFGADHSRVELMPEVVKRIRDAGHFCEYTTIDLVFFFSSTLFRFAGKKKPLAGNFFEICENL